MKNYNDSDYALNKYSTDIVYRFSDGIMTVTLADYLTENPGKTEADFYVLKELSDAIYQKQNRDDYRRTWKDIPLYGLDGTTACAAPSPEDEVIEKPERKMNDLRRRELAGQALDTLTEVQRRRYLLYAANGLTTREIAEKEGVGQRTVMDSIQWAEKKIKKFLSGTKK